MTPPEAIAAGADALLAEIAVIGSGPGGAVTATLLAEAGHDVLLIEEGPHLALDSAPHFSREEILQKYRNGGITVAMGKAKIAYVEARCVGGGSEINRGLYHRTPPEVLETWEREFRLAGASPDQLRPHFEACEQVAGIAYLPGEAPAISLRLRDGAAKLQWQCIEVPRLVRYTSDRRTGVAGGKQSMTETFVPRALAAGARLLPDTRVLRLTRSGGRWRLRAEHTRAGTRRRALEITATIVFVAGGAIQTPALLRRSGFTRKVGDSLAFHPMVKVVACFAEPVNQLSDLEPVHQVKQFDPRFSLGCSVSKRPALALALADHPEWLAAVDRNWRHMAIYYAQSTGGRGVVRTLPGFHDPLVRTRYSRADMTDLADGLRCLCECLLAAGAVAIYPSLVGAPAVRSAADLSRLPPTLPVDGANVTALHLFSSCPMGEDEMRCVTDSFGRLRGADGLYIADASLLCTPTVVNPQGSVMAIAHRNALEFLGAAQRPLAA